MKKTLWLLLLLAGTASAQSTANLWIDTNGGTCTRQGTPAVYSDGAACGSFTAAYNAASGGDTIYVKAGTYGSQTVPSRSLSTSVVTISAAPGETVTTGSIEIQSNYVTINGFRLGSNDIYIQPTGTGTSPSNSVCTRHHVTVSNNVMTGVGAGIVGGCDNISLIGNEISGTNVCNGGPEDSMQIISFGNWGTYIPSNILIKDNYVHDMAQAEGQCAAHADGIQFAGCINCTIDGNRFNRTDTSHIIMYAPQTGQAHVRNIVVQNNSFGTVLEPGHGTSIGGHSCTTADNIVHQNNTYYTANTMDINCSSGGAAAISRNNIFAVNDSGFSCNNNHTFSYNVWATGGCGTFKKNCSPSFIDSSHTNGDVRLSSGDTCAKDYPAGGGGTFPALDMFGTSRPQGSLPDAGAFEIVSGGGGDVTPPTASLTAPADAATVDGTETVSATASDDTAVVGVQFKLDGANLGSEDISSPYSISWDTTTAGNGSRTLSCLARDAAGNTVTCSSITVTVSNTVVSDRDTPTKGTAKKGYNGGGTSVSATGFSSGANAVLLCAVTTDDNGNSTHVTGITVGGAPTYSTAWVQKSRVFTSGFLNHELWYAFATSAISNQTITATLTPSERASMVCQSYTDADPNNPVPAAFDASTSVLVTNTNRDNSLYVGAFGCGDNASRTVTAGSGYTVDESQNFSTTGVWVHTALETKNSAVATAADTTVDVSSSCTNPALIGVEIAGVPIDTEDSTPPEASLTAPAAGPLTGSSTVITASCTDDTAVAGVQFKLNGVNFADEDIVSPYSIPWNFLGGSPGGITYRGSYTLSCVCRDTTGNTDACADVPVTINNGPLIKGAVIIGGVMK